MSFRADREHRDDNIPDDTTVMPGDILVCYGHDDVQETLAEDLSKLA